jgi:galactose-1-phosphate uridylyltransferase
MLPGNIEFHSDLYSPMPVVLSHRRKFKPAQPPQMPMQDMDGPDNCILCNPELKDSFLTKRADTPNCQKRVAQFLNDYPYLPYQQHVLFMWNEDLQKRKRNLHRFCLKDLDTLELYWLLWGCVEHAKAFKRPVDRPDIPRMVVGFNFGPMAGQSIPHFHAQCGWDVVLDSNAHSEAHSEQHLDLYLSELRAERLTIFESEGLLIHAPWTPRGAYAVDIMFKGKFSIEELGEEDAKAFAVLGISLIRKYLKRGIQNVTIVFTNSAMGCRNEPLVAHFVPRLNVGALYEIRGVNVVDTLPQDIVAEFLSVLDESDKLVSWAQLLEVARRHDPNAKYDHRLAHQD